MKNNILKTLFVGIDVSSITNVLCALDFIGDKLLNLKALNNQPGAESILQSIISCLDSNSLEYAVIALESTSFYSTHIANFLASNERLLAYKPLVYCLNPKTVSNYRKSFVDMYKTDPLDAFVSEKGKNRFSDPVKTATLLQKPARDSYRLDKVLYEPLNVSIASSFNVIKALEDEVKTIDKAIEKTIKGINTNEFQSLTSIPGIGPVLASGILSEIGTIISFKSHDSLAKYAGLTWRETLKYFLNLNLFFL